MRDRAVTIPPPGVLVSEMLAGRFPGWDISVSPQGCWTAFRSSPDGRARHYVVAPVAGELAMHLDGIVARADAVPVTTSSTGGASGKREGR